VSIKKFIFLFLFFNLLGALVFAQGMSTYTCASQKQTYQIYAKQTIAYSQEDQYDIKYVKLDLHMTCYSTQISGCATTVAKVMVPVMRQYVFEIVPSLIVDSVRINGVSRAFHQDTNAAFVVMPQNIGQDDMFTSEIFYHGSSAVGIFSVNDVINNVTYTKSEPYAAYGWFPCKQSLTDKIDSADIWITVPDTLKVGSNGVLNATTKVGGGLLRYEWKERMPIDYYLLSVAIGNYLEYSFYIHFPGSSDSMLVLNYLAHYSLDANFKAAKSVCDSIGMAIIYFSSLFGRYPFWKEKYGHSYTLYSLGAMENQTMTSTGLIATGILSHELGHQWFGDNVTCATWKDIWLNEGIATYSEYLYHTNFEGKNSGDNYMDMVHASVLSRDSGTVYVRDTTAYGNIFNQRLSYYKGASVFHMLRFLFNDDDSFFAMLQQYQRQFGGSTATTEDFKNVAEQFIGTDLDYFFEQWIYREGYPKYATWWNQEGNLVYVKLNQVTAIPGSVSLFKTPLEIKLFSQQGDTVIRLYNDQNWQLFQVICDKIIDSVSIDPNHWLVCKNISKPAKDPTITTLTNNIEVYPNPVRDIVSIRALDLDGAYLILTDASGKSILNEKLPVAIGINQVDIHALATGVYYYAVIQGKLIKAKGKLVKRP